MRCLMLLLLAACADPDPDPAPDAGGKEQISVGACDGLLTIEHNVGARHVDSDADLVWTNNPPTSGPHYPTWAAWDREYTELKRGYWVHDAEHGGIILLYRCDAGCPDVVAQLETAARNMPPDPACKGAITKRVIVTADPLLPDGVQVAAVAWNHAYTASCYDAYVETFARENYAHAPEDFCTEGVSLGGTPLNP